MRKVLLAFFLAGCALAQSISITAPSGNPTISATTYSYTFTVSLSSLPTVYQVEYFLDGNLIGTSSTSPYSFVWNPYYTWNGPHNVTAKALDASNTVLATSSAAPFTFGGSWAYVQPPTGPQGGSYNASISCTPGTPVTSSWSGSVNIVCSLSGTYTSSFSYKWQIRIDGQLANQYGTGSTPQTLVAPTTNYVNGAHQVEVQVGAGGIGFDGLDWYGSWESTVTFANGASAMELRTDARRVILCVTSATNCLTSHTLTATVYNTDSTTTAATSPTFSATSYVYPSTTVCSVGASSGVITALAMGDCWVAVSANGFTRNVWVQVFNNSNTLPHFGSDGSLLSSYNPAKSIYLNSAFLSDESLNTGGGTFLPYPAFGTDYAATFNTMETGAFCYQPGGTQTDFQTNETACFNGVIPFPNTYNLFIHLTGDSMMRGDPTTYNTVYGPGASYSPTAVAYAWQQWQTTRRVVGVTMIDEVERIWGHKPRGAIPQMGTGGFTSIVAAGSTEPRCTVNWTDYSIQTGNNIFIITGATSAGFNIANSSASPNSYAVNNVNSNQFTFSCPSVANGTYNSTTDPNLVIQPMFQQWDTSTGYDLYDVFPTFMSMSNAASSRPAFTWAASGGSYPEASQNWMGDANMSDYEGDMYWGPNTQWFQSTMASLPSLIADMGDLFQQNFPTRTTPAAWLAETQANDTQYGLQGQSLTVTSCSGSTVIFSSPHGMTVVNDAVSRFSVTGSSGGACDGQYYIYAIVSSTAVSVYLAKPNFTANVSTGTIHYQDTTTTAVGSITISQNYVASTFLPASDPSCNEPTHSGGTVTFSGTGNTTLNSTTFWYLAYSRQTCTGSQNLGLIGQIPNLSSTGGTAILLPDNYLHRGINWSLPINGPMYHFATAVYAMILGAAGQRAYQYGGSYQGDAMQFDPATGKFSSGLGSANWTFTDTGTVQQSGMNPKYDNTGTQQTWYSFTNPNNLFVRLAKYIFQPRLAAPDYGQFFETTVRTGTYGNLLAVQSFANAARPSTTITLSPYLVSGQQILKYYMTWTTLTMSVLSAGTASDTVNFDPGAVVIYVFPQNFSTEYNPAVVNPNLSSVAGATSASILYGYNPYFFNSLPKWQALPLPSVSSSGGNTTLPADLNMGTVYYQVIYLNSGGVPIQTSSVQSVSSVAPSVNPTGSLLASAGSGSI